MGCFGYCNDYWLLTMLFGSEGNPDFRWYELLESSRNAIPRVPDVVFGLPNWLAGMGYFG